MRKEHWYMIGLALLAVMVVVLAFVLAGAFAGWVAMLFAAPGTATAFGKWIKVDTDNHRRQAEIDAKEKQDLDALKRDEQLQAAQAERDRAEAKKQIDDIVGKVETKQDVDDAIDRALDHHDQHLRKYGGFINITIAVVVFIVALLSMPMFAMAKTEIATAKDKARLKRLLTQLKRYEHLVDNMSKRHKREKERLRIKYDALVAKLQSKVRALEQKLAILANKPVPPTWPLLLAGAATGALIVGGVWIGNSIANRGK